MLSHEHLIRSVGGFTPDRWARGRDLVWHCLEARWPAIGVLVSGATVGLLLAADAVPGVLAPLVLGPVIAMGLTTLVAHGERTTAAEHERDDG